MKSVVHENSTIAKAVDNAWKKAGCPEQFFIKILEHPTKSFWVFGSKQKAKVALFFEEKQGSKKQQPSSDSLLEQKEYKHLFDELKHTDFDLLKDEKLLSKKKNAGNQKQKRFFHNNKHRNQNKNHVKQPTTSGEAQSGKNAGQEAVENKHGQGTSQRRHRKPYRGRRFQGNKKPQAQQNAKDNSGNKS